MLKLSGEVTLLKRLSPQYALYAAGLKAVEDFVRGGEQVNIMDSEPELCTGCGGELGAEAYRRLPSLDLLCLACLEKQKERP